MKMKMVSEIHLINLIKSDKAYIKQHAHFDIFFVT